MHLRPIEHLENRRPNCKKHTQERQLTRFFCILQLIYKENRTDGFSKTNQNRTRTELEKSIPHIPNADSTHVQTGRHAQAHKPGQKDIHIGTTGTENTWSDVQLVQTDRLIDIYKGTSFLHKNLTDSTQRLVKFGNSQLNKTDQIPQLC